MRLFFVLKRRNTSTSGILYSLYRRGKPENHLQVPPSKLPVLVGMFHVKKRDEKPVNTGKVFKVGDYKKGHIM